jgi:hypothetical protein
MSTKRLTITSMKKMLFKPRLVIPARMIRHIPNIRKIMLMLIVARKNGENTSMIMAAIRKSTLIKSA